MERPGPGQSGRQEIEGFERFFNIFGWLGFLAILPVALGVFGFPQLQDLLAKSLGSYGTKGFFLLVFFVLVFVRVVFGSGRIIAPLLIASAVGFVFIATAAGVPFMAWLREPAVSSPFFSNMPLNFLVGLGVVLLGILMSSARRIPMALQILVLVILPLAIVIAAGSTGFASGLRKIGG